jgi:hypothetical protein
VYTQDRDTAHIITSRQNAMRIAAIFLIRRTMKMKMKMNDKIEKNPELFTDLEKAELFTDLEKAERLSIQEAFGIFLKNIQEREKENQKSKKNEGFKR